MFRNRTRHEERGTDRFALGLALLVLLPAGAATAATEPLSTDGTVRTELAVEFVLADLLYSPGVSGAVAKCVSSTEAKWSAEIRAEVAEAAKLPTRSAQQQAVARLAETQRMVPFRARAECMATTLMYLGFANRDVAVQWSRRGTGGIEPLVETLIRTAGDLSTAGLSDLSLLLESYASGAVTRCGPWVIGEEFRKYVTDERLCRDGLRMAASRDFNVELKLDTIPGIFKTQSDGFVSSLRACYRGNEIEVPSGSDAEAYWRASCRLARLTGLKATDVQPPDFSLLQAGAAVDTAPSAATRVPVRVPPNAQGRGARISMPEYPPASRRAGEQGVVTLEVLVLEDGRVGEIKIANSSGFPKLDEAAVKEAQRNWRLVPGKEDGKPVSMWHTLTATFRLAQ